MKHTIINAVLFQCVWFAAILAGVGYALPFLIALVCHAYVFERRQHSVALVLSVVVAGLCADSLFFSFGYFSDVTNEAGQGSLAVGVMPLWLASIWCAFALTLGSSMSWYKKKPLVFVLLAGIAAPISYTAGDRMGALMLDSYAVYLVSLFWVALASAIVWGQFLVQFYRENKPSRVSA